MRALAACLFAATVLSSPSFALESHCEGQEDNLQTYIEMTRILFNERQHERAAEYYADEFVSHNVDGGGLGTNVRTPEHMQNLWIHSKKTSPGRELINDLIVCRDDLLVARVTVKGVRVGNLKGSPPEGRPYEASATDIYRFKDGKVVERWGNSDLIAIIRQTGLQIDLSMTPLKD